ncbi:MAG: type I 3-dehydroquinate dehydratase [Archaeoglobaceae archaeon]|nr:type I 3-dehydroquinate dehydratase [Archaeoglobaceae archaeon]
MKLVATVSNSSEIRLANKADLIELRIDLGSFESVPQGKYIITCRREKEGGLYRGDEERRMEKIKYFVEKTDARFVDLEFDLPDNYFTEFNCEIIESYHNFVETPECSFMKDLLESRRGDYLKIATLGRTFEDWKKIVKILLEYDNVIAFLMGEKFKFTRIFSAFLGSPLIYCYVGTKKAPGQLELGEALEVLRFLGVRE